MTPDQRIASLSDQLALVLGIAIGVAHKHHDTDSIRLLLECDFAKQLAAKEPDRLIGQLMRTYGPESPS